MYETKEEVHNRALEAVGKTLKEINGGVSLEHSAAKSGAGDAFEAWFGKVKDSDSEPDLPEAGVELKATPIKKNKRGKYEYSAKERLVLNIINYEEVVKSPFKKSHFLHKNKRIELAFYEHQQDIYKDDFIIKNVALYEMSKNPVDFKIIEEDWHIIDTYIKEGKAHELSERLTTYLSPCTKGASSKSIRKQPFSEIPAKQRAYSLKTGYMTYLYNTYVLGVDDSESIITDPFDLENKSFQDIILEKIEPYIGKTVDELCQTFKVKKGTKSTNPEILKYILGLKDDAEKTQEFIKANIKPKTVVVEKGKQQLKEEFKIQEYKFVNVVNETWEESDLKDFLEETTFLISVFEKEGTNETLIGVKFWGISEQDIDINAKHVYEDTVSKIKSGVEITWTPNKKTTNFINSSEEDKLFSKLSASQTSYREIHKSGSRYSEKLPSKIKWINRPDDEKENYTDWYMTKQAWWLNKKYMYEQIKELFDKD
ncbi:Sau3AI family type II restriction endonuclease [Lysinibacillus xylanilyticus]|uniref:DNA mismatch repair protein MutH n=1 Tax=Lysinibacillus xylanilyticus TaxID=582475 RepID=A0A2M9QA31_9BACI|nr:Sau3AI family type II restriction endonuclease [Lysinibacillus xylanilyticus]PJO44919.1 DNA mismatch repair protein MutH [Lysinibacillus xylanilyticus]